jgi:hypothetical protein
MEGGITILLIVLAVVVVGGLGLFLYLTGMTIGARDDGNMLHRSAPRRSVKARDSVRVGGTHDSAAARAARRAEREAEHRSRPTA